MSNQCRNCGRDVNNNYTPYTNAYGNKTNAKNDSSSSKISNSLSSSSSTSLSQPSSVAATTTATIATGKLHTPTLSPFSIALGCCAWSATYVAKPHQVRARFVNEILCQYAQLNFDCTFSCCFFVFFLFFFLFWLVPLILIHVLYSFPQLKLCLAPLVPSMNSEKRNRLRRIALQELAGDNDFQV